MCHVAAEMERQGFELPLLIGGATTSRVHTAVKIHPNYQRGQTVYVTDASRAVGVGAGADVARDARAGYVADIRDEYAQHRRRACARRRRTSSGCRSRTRAPTRSSSTGRRYHAAEAAASSARKMLDDYPLAELVAVHRLDAVLPDLGADRQISRRSSTTRSSARPRARSSTTRRRC